MIIEQIKKTDDFTSVEKEIIDFINKQTNIVINLSLEEFSKKCFVSQASIIRLCKKLGTKGYSDFKIKLAKELNTFIANTQQISVDIPINRGSSTTEIMDTFYNLSNQSLEKTKNNLDPLSISNAAHLLNSSDIIHIYGRGESLILAEDFQYKLMRLGKHCHLDALNGFNENQNHRSSKLKECAVVISQYCDSNQLHYIMEELVSSKVPIILLTAAKNIWPYDTYAEILFRIECDEKRNKMGCFSSRTSFLYILDCIYGSLFSINYEKNKEYLIKCANQKAAHNYFYRNFKKIE